MASATPHLPMQGLENATCLRDCRISFHRYLQLKQGPKEVPVNPSFDLFSRLAVEVKHLVLDHCEYTTLFNLMHTNAELRLLAQPRFWSHESVWYRVDANFLSFILDIKDGLQDLTCPYFSKAVQQIELQRLEWHLNPRHRGILSFRGDRRRRQQMPELQLLIKDYWPIMLETYPSVRRMIINDCRGSQPATKNYFEEEFTAFALAAPSHVQVLLMRCDIDCTVDSHNIAHSQYGCNAHRNIHTFSVDGGWTLLHRKWERYPVLPPKRRIPGLIGEFLHYVGCDYEHFVDLLVLAHLRVQTYEHHFFGGLETSAFTCPYPDCEQRFEKAGEYTVHIAGNWHHTGATSLLYVKEPSFPSPLPDDLEQQLTAGEQNYKAAYKESQEAQANYFRSWGSWKSDTYQKMEQEFIQQMRAHSMLGSEFGSQVNVNDPKVMKRLRRHWIWRELQNLLDIYDDTRWLED